MQLQPPLYRVVPWTWIPPCKRCSRSLWLPMVWSMAFIKLAKHWTSKSKRNVPPDCRFIRRKDGRLISFEFSFLIARRQAVLAILAESCDEPQYKKLVTALCNEHQIPLIRVDSNKKLGEWSGLCKIDKEGKPRKVCGCSVVVIKVSECLLIRFAFGSIRNWLFTVLLSFSFSGFRRGNTRFGCG